MQKSMVVNNILEYIGNTPMVKLNKIDGLQSNVYLKLESYNPSGSSKDRTVLKIIENAEKQNKIFPGKTTIIEATTGNTGIALAMICAIKNYKCIIVGTYSMPLEKKLLLYNYGASLVLTSNECGMLGACAKAVEICEELNGDGYILNQFTDENAISAHEETTAPEIWKQMNGNIDMIVGGVGTGATLIGIKNYMKNMNSMIEIVAVEPEESSVLSGNAPGRHTIQGIGVGFVPDLVKSSDVFDKIVCVSSDDARKTVNDIMKTEGISVGYSSGATIYAAIQQGMLPENRNKNIIAIVASSAERYLYTNLFEENFINIHKIPISEIKSIF